MLRAAMPETTIYKNCDLLITKNEIRSANDRLVATPTGNSVAAQDLHEPQLRFLIPLRPNTGHHRRSRSRGKDVGHWNQLSIRSKKNEG
jgi:hypothetical protein